MRAGYCRRRSKKQDGLRAELVQEQKNRKIISYIDLYGLIEKKIIIVFNNTKKLNKICMNRLVLSNFFFKLN